MIDRDEALHLFEYDAWANECVERMLREHAPRDREALNTYGHLVAVQDLWLRRVLGEEYAGVDAHPEPDLDTCSTERVRLAQRWRTFLKTISDADLAREIVFLNLKGVECRDRLESIVRQVTNHGAHHRGQLSARVRTLGGTPPWFDYIVWRRERSAQLRPTKHFAILVSYVAPLSRIDELVVEHRAHLERGFASGMLLASGPQVPREGGVILARSASREAIEAFVALDPFARERVAEFRVVEFDPIKRSPAFEAWVASP